jgi:hypothetical protein
MTRTQVAILVVLAIVVACALYWAASYAINVLPTPIETKAIVTPADKPPEPPVHTAGQKLTVPAGKLSEMDDYPKGGEVFVQKKNGTTDPRPNDLEELCKDWLFYRKQISKYTASGDTEKTERARAAFQDVNIYLSEYADSDVAAMFDILERMGYEPP